MKTGENPESILTFADVHDEVNGDLNWKRDHLILPKSCYRVIGWLCYVPQDATVYRDKDLTECIAARWWKG